MSSRILIFFMTIFNCLSIEKKCVFEFISDFWTFSLDVSKHLDFLQSNFWLLLKVTEGTTEHQKLPKTSKNSMNSSFYAKRAKKLWPKVKPPAGARSKPA